MDSDYDFYRGVLVCLQYLSANEYEVAYHEIVKTVGVDGLVNVARAEIELELSGLRKYGYC